jgi:DHA2 family multidrug resistance protein
MTLRSKLIIITVLLAAVMELIDTTIVNVALSHMSGNLGATLEDTSWVITSYAIANVIIIPMTSFLTARLGRRKYYIGSIILFTICSFLCGQASGIWMLVFFRFFQGLGGGALLSVSQAVVFEQFPKSKQSVARCIHRSDYRPHHGRFHYRGLLMALDILCKYTHRYNRRSFLLFPVDRIAYCNCCKEN